MASLLINLTSSLYFSFVSSWFRFLNYFRRRQLVKITDKFPFGYIFVIYAQVDKPTDDLLMISAGEVAAMIRRGEVISLIIITKTAETMLWADEQGLIATNFYSRYLVRRSAGIAWACCRQQKVLYIAFWAGPETEVSLFEDRVNCSLGVPRPINF